MPEQAAQQAGLTLALQKQVTELQPGQWVQHKTFGPGLVLETGGDPLESEAAWALVNFDEVGKKGIATRVARMRLVPECDWSVRQRTLSIAAIQATVVLPRTEEEFKPLTDIQLEAMQGRSWIQSAQRPDKRHRQQYRLQNGERLTPVVKSLPLPWTSHAVLCLVQAGTPEAPGYRGRHRAGTTRGGPKVHSPRVIVGATPPYKKLRAVLYGAVQRVTAAGDVVVNDIKACCAKPASEGNHFFDFFEATDHMHCRDGTKLLLAEMRRRVFKAIQDLRATAHANGRWWPAPESFQVILKADGSFAARLRFTASYQPAKRPWIEWSK